MNVSSNDKWLMLASGALLVAMAGSSIFFFQFYTRVKAGSELAAQAVAFSQVGNGETRVLILGDSLAFGVGASSPETSFAGRIAARLPGATIVNKADVGAETHDIAVGKESLIDGNYDALLVIIGGNDIVRPSVSIDDSKRNMSEFIEFAASRAHETFIITTGSFDNVSLIPKEPTNYYQKRALALRNHVASAAERFDTVQYIDAFGMKNDDYALLEAADGFHLNDDGIEALVELIDFTGIVR